MVVATQTRPTWSWVTITVLSVAVGAYALFLTVTGFAFVPGNVKANAFPSPLGLEIHIAASAFALLMGPWQFRRSLRLRRPHVHRWMGRTYATACVVGGIAGASIAMFSSSGPVAGYGFLLLGVLWALTTVLGWVAALQRRYADHERWMTRSFALAFAAVTLRIYLPIGIMMNDGDFYTPYRVIAWLCWVPNLVLVEVWLRMRGATQGAMGSVRQ
jgi:hypothetical protein